MRQNFEPIEAEYRLTVANVQEGLKYMGGIKGLPGAEGFGTRKKMVIMGVLLLLGLLSLPFLATRFAAIAVLMVLIAVYFCYRVLLLPTLRRAAVAKQIAGMAQTYRVVVDEEALTVVEGGEAHPIAYKSLSAYEAQEVLIFVEGDQQMVIVPKSCFTQRLDELRQLLKERIGAKWRPLEQ